MNNKNRVMHSEKTRRIFWTAIEDGEPIHQAATRANVPRHTGWYWIRSEKYISPFTGNLIVFKKSGRPPIKYTDEHWKVFWSEWNTSKSVSVAARAAGVPRSLAYQKLKECNYRNPFVSYTEVMSKRYLTVYDREKIMQMNDEGCYTLQDIANEVGKNKSTISRELKRNSKSRENYLAITANKKAVSRRRRPKVPKLIKDPELRDIIQGMLKQKMSPEEISGRLTILFPDDISKHMSHESIYQSIYIESRGSLKRELIKDLRKSHQVRKRMTRGKLRPGKIKDMINIRDRPAEIEDRLVPGHWEGDLIIGKDHKSAIGTLVERTSRAIRLVYLPEGKHDAKTVNKEIQKAVKDLPHSLIKSITWDQGVELARHKELTEESNIDVYFCDPHSPWQRGSNENTNGLLRQYFPKKTDLRQYSRKYLKFVEDEMNNRPRKILGYYTPAEILNEKLKNLETKKN